MFFENDNLIVAANLELFHDLEIMKTLDTLSNERGQASDSMCQLLTC